MLRLIILLLLSISIQAQSLWEEANNHYDQKEYEIAISKYEDLYNQQLVSFDLFFNMGNTYFRLNRFAEATLSYEKALLIKPNDSDAIYNLFQLNKQKKDKIELVPNYDLEMLMKTISTYVSPSILTFFSYLIILLFLAFLLLKGLKKEKVRFIWLLLVLLSAIGVYGFANWLKSEASNYQEAIIFSSRVNIKSSPANAGTSLFTLHEGTKVRVLDSKNDWLRIYLDSEKIGWIQTNEVELIIL